MKKNNLVFKFFLIILISLTILSINYDCFFCKIFADAEEKAIPILMYHSILKSKRGCYVVSPSLLESDIKYLIEQGFKPVFVKEIINFCEGNGELPEKPVVLTFDDGHFNNYYYAFPILKKHNFKATLNVIGSFSEFSTSSGDIDNPNYSYVTWEEIKELHDSGIFEIGNHSYKMHQYKPRFGIQKKNGESSEEYANALTKDIKLLEDKFKNECGFNTEVFAYPFGAYSKESEKILRKNGFKAFLTCNEGINKVQKGNDSVLSHLKRINRNGNFTTYEMFKKFNIK